MSYAMTNQKVRQDLSEIFAEVDTWFDKPEDLRRYKPNNGGWSINQILEHIKLTSHYLLIIINRHSEKAIKKARDSGIISGGESDLELVTVVGQRGSFVWIRPEHMEPTDEPSRNEVREEIKRQTQHCISLLERMANGEGSLVKVNMSVNGLGKLDMYQWIYFVAQHAQRHLQQMQAIENEFA
jgi:DinB superfamily